MRRRLTPIGWITKYLLLPIAVGVIGFYVLGPKVGASTQANKPLNDLIQNSVIPSASNALQRLKSATDTAKDAQTVKQKGKAAQTLVAPPTDPTP